MCDLAEITGCMKPTVYMISKSDMKMSKASARRVPRLLSEDDSGYNQASYIWAKIWKKGPYGNKSQKWDFYRERKTKLM